MIKSPKLLLIIAQIILVLSLSAQGTEDSTYDDQKVITAVEVMTKIKNCEPIKYDGVTIKGNLDLSQVGLNRSKEGKKVVSSSISIADSKIEGNFDFNGAAFQRGIDIRKTTFSGDVDFSDAEFSDGIFFLQTTFDGNAYFTASNFKKDIMIISSTFNRQADFTWTQFNDVADFAQSQFNALTSFYASEFNEDAVFLGTQFNGHTIFQNSKFNGVLDLTQTRFALLQIDWDTIKDNVVADGNGFLSLTRSFEDSDNFEDADDCYYHYRLMKMNREGQLHFKLLDITSWLSCGFGVRPIYTLIWSLVFIMVFGLIYWTFKAIQKSSKGYAISYATQYNSSIRSKLADFTDALYFSTMIFFVSHPPTDYRPSDKWIGWKYIVMLEDVSGWLLLTLFVVTMTHVMIRS